MGMANRIKTAFQTPEAEAHCDGPCGVYDPASARIAAEAAKSMTKKMLDLKHPDGGDDAAKANYLNTMARFATIKEEQADIAKRELLVLWTDFFKPEHLDAYPDLHDTFWKAAKACSEVKQHVSLEAADTMMAAVEKVHGMFWGAKSRDVGYYLANP